MMVTDENLIRVLSWVVGGGAVAFLATIWKRLNKQSERSDKMQSDSDAKFISMQESITSLMGSMMLREGQLDNVITRLGILDAAMISHIAHEEGSFGVLQKDITAIKISLAEIRGPQPNG